MANKTPVENVSVVNDRMDISKEDIRSLVTFIYNNERVLLYGAAVCTVTYVFIKINKKFGGIR